MAFFQKVRMAEENRFLRCVQEHREEQRRLSYDPNNRFERTYAEHKGIIKPIHRQSYDSEDRFRCLRDEYPPGQYRYQQSQQPQPQQPQHRRESPPSYSEYDVRRQVIPKKPRALTIDDTEQFPSLPSSPGSKTPKTPKTPLVTPLREEFEFIPLPKSHTTDVISLKTGKSIEPTDNSSQQYYQVVKKITGGSWSDRLKVSLELQKEQEEEDIEGMEYDEDGFPILRSVKDLVD